jgi:hypothetical protein
MLILVQYGFVGFTTLLNILDLIVYIAGDQIKEDHLDEETVIRMQVLGGRARKEETTRRPKCRWENNIKMDLKLTARESIKYVHLIQDCFRQWWEISNTTEIWNYVICNKFLNQVLLLLSQVRFCPIKWDLCLASQ